MNIYHRRNFFVVFAIFFVITTPLIVIYSLGFDINYKETQIQNSLSVKIKTNPAGTQIDFGDKVLAQNGQYETNIAPGQATYINFDSKNYYKENILISSDANSNSLVDLTNFALLPKLGEFISKDSSLVQVLSSNYVITKEDENFFVKSFSFQGFNSPPRLITNQNFVSSKPTSKISLSQDQLAALNNKTPWQRISSNQFYKNNQLLSIVDNYWQITTITIPDSAIKSITKSTNNQLFVVDAQNNLWSYNSQNQDILFVDQGIRNVFAKENSNQIWIWKKDSLYKLELEDFVNQRTIQDRNLQLKSPILNEVDDNFFEIKNLFQGNAIRVGNYLIYSPDYRTSQYEVISDSTREFATSGETVFWIQSNGQISSYNLNTSYKKILSETDQKIISISYSKDNNRLFLFGESSVLSIWENKDTTNFSILKRQLTNWITDQYCFGSILEQNLYCQQSSNLVKYPLR